MKRLLFALLAPLCLGAAAPAPAPAPAARELSRVSFAAVGDVLPHMSVKRSAEAADQRDADGKSANNGGYDALFAQIAADLGAADLTFANLETPVSPSGDKGAVEFHFNAPPALLAGLTRAGVDLVSFANNHVYDQGRRGLVETLAELDKAGLPQAGAGAAREAAERGLRLEKNGIRIAVLAATQFFNEKKIAAGTKPPGWCNLIGDAAWLEAAVRQARTESDFVIVSMHWGVEYQPAPRESEIELSRRLFEAGADVILGHHPHVLQPIELFQTSDGRTCAVIYSLGNFISNQSRQYAHGVSAEKVGDTRDSAMLRFSIVKRDYGKGVVRAELADLRYLPLWTENDFLTRLPKQAQEIRVVSIPRAAAALEAELAKPAEASAAACADAARVRAMKRLEMLRRRQELIRARLGEQFEAAPTP